MSFPLPFGWSQSKVLLLLFNVLAGIVLIAISHTRALPLDAVNFFFFSFVGFLFALYRPGWVFLLLIGMLPYENISIAPADFGITLRPYQWLLVLVILALLVRLALKRFPLQKFVPNFWDISIIVFGISAFFSALTSAEKDVAIKLCIILFSFILLYFVTRIFVQSIDDARMLLPFLLSSFLVISMYAILQNIFFQGGKESFEVMAGRPNATFFEADWLGGYLAMMLVALSALIASLFLPLKNLSLKQTHFIFSVFLFFGYVALILSVSRSAWLATFFGIAAVLFLFAWQRGIWEALLLWNKEILLKALQTKLFILLPFLLALFTVLVFDLSPFDLFDRTNSVASGEQKITIACEKKISLPEKISSIEELQVFGCSHINVEDIAAKRAAGKYVAEISRNDPNVEIRLDTYERTGRLLREHWLSGIGFGVISQYLGTDGRGAGLNASNIFLEVWLGTGLVGFLAFVFFWFGLGLKWLFIACKKGSPLALILGSVFTAVTIFNFFNSGLFLAWFFVLLAFLAISLSETSHE